MKNCFISMKKIFITIILFSIAASGLVRSVYASKVVIAPDKSKILWIVGDSYAGICAAQLGSDYCNFTACETGCIINDETKSIIDGVLSETSKFVFLGIGIHDYHYETNPVYFKYTINDFLSKAIATDKILIVMSYMNSPFAKSTMLTKKYKIEDYDNVLKSFIGNPNYRYINMKDYENDNYISSDKIHYNEEFYQILSNRLMSVIAVNNK